MSWPRSFVPRETQHVQAIPFTHLSDYKNVQHDLRMQWGYESGWDEQAQAIVIFIDGEGGGTKTYLRVGQTAFVHVPGFRNLRVLSWGEFGAAYKMA